MAKNVHSQCAHLNTPRLHPTKDLNPTLIQNKRALTNDLPTLVTDRALQAPIQETEDPPVHTIDSMTTKTDNKDNKIFSTPPHLIQKMKNNNKQLKISMT